MRNLTLDELRRLVVDAAGEPEEGELGDDTGTATFGDLGYESLALMEVAARIQQEYGVTLDEEALPVMTPGELVERVNRQNGVTL
jgi:act minimal PKS acyl carrier protein